MRNEVLSLVAAAALLGSMGAVDAKQPVKLTDAQLDMATAGNNASVESYGVSTASVGVPLGWPNGGAQVSMASSMNGQGVRQANMSTGANAVQQNSMAAAGAGGS